jgi:hypothetical protein
VSWASSGEDRVPPTGGGRSPAYRNTSDSSTARAPSMPPCRRSRRIVPQRLFRDAPVVGIRSGLRGEASRRTRGLRYQARAAQVRDRGVQRLCDPPEIDGRAPAPSLFQALQCGEADAAGARQVGKADTEAPALSPHEPADDAVRDKARVFLNAGQRPTPPDSGRRARLPAGSPADDGRTCNCPRPCRTGGCTWAARLRGGVGRGAEVSVLLRPMASRT